jgi:hypothetical protein
MQLKIMYTTQKQVRAAFKEVCPAYKTSKKHNDQTCDVRYTFSMFVDSLRRDGLISEKLAVKVTL